MIFTIIDSVLIAPFRWIPHPLAGLWFGCSILAVYAVILGEITSSLLFMLNGDYYAEQQKKMTDAHNRSVNALHAGDKEAYFAINRMAHEYFGKFFFSQAALGMSSLWPVPFALHWLSLRFEGIQVFGDVPLKLHVGYVFVFAVCYIVIRIRFGKLRPKLPFFRKIYIRRQEIKESCGQLKSFFSQNSAADTSTASTPPEATAISSENSGKPAGMTAEQEISTRTGIRTGSRKTDEPETANQREHSHLPPQ